MRQSHKKTSANTSGGGNDSALLPRLLLVEDDAEQREELADFLRISGFFVAEADTAEAALPLLAQGGWQLFVLDIGLPGESGVSLVDAIRERFGLGVGVVMVTARSFRQDKLEARGAGADDYLVKPVDFDELLMVLRHLLCRLEQMPGAQQERWGLLKDGWRLQLPSGEVLPLSETEFRLLQVLLAARGEAVDRRAIVVELGHSLAYYDLRRLDVLVSRLRQKVQQQFGVELPLRTVHGVGYAFVGAAWS
jgi:DNA-binding response OmpR family regulator